MGDPSTGVVGSGEAKLFVEIGGNVVEGFQQLSNSLPRSTNKISVEAIGHHGARVESDRDVETIHEAISGAVVDHLEDLIGLTSIAGGHQIEGNGIRKVFGVFDGAEMASSLGAGHAFPVLINVNVGNANIIVNSEKSKLSDPCTSGGGVVGECIDPFVAGPRASGNVGGSPQNGTKIES